MLQRYEPGVRGHPDRDLPPHPSRPHREAAVCTATGTGRPCSYPGRAADTAAGPTWPPEHPSLLAAGMCAVPLGRHAVASDGRGKTTPSPDSIPGATRQGQQPQPEDFRRPPRGHRDGQAVPCWPWSLAREGRPSHLELSHPSWGARSPHLGVLRTKPEATSGSRAKPCSWEPLPGQTPHSKDNWRVIPFLVTKANAPSNVSDQSAGGQGSSGGDEGTLSLTAHGPHTRLCTQLQTPWLPESWAQAPRRCPAHGIFQSDPFPPAPEPFTAH